MKKDFTKPKRKLLPPSRALLATMPDGRLASATWVNLDGRWRCFSASKPLRWLRGYTLAMEDVPGTLNMISKNWNWITPVSDKVASVQGMKNFLSWLVFPVMISIYAFTLFRQPHTTIMVLIGMMAWCFGWGWLVRKCF